MDENKGTRAGSTAPARRRMICTNCRRRKSKCDSLKPQCSTCVAHNSQCVYDTPPSLAYVRSLEAKIERLLRDGCAPGTREIRNNPLDAANDSEPNEHNTTSTPATFEKSSSTDSIEDISSQRYQKSEAWVSEISVDSRGAVSYHNATSAIHEAPLGRDASTCSPRPSVDNASERSVQENMHIKSMLVSNAALQKQFEELALENLPLLQSEIPAEMANEILKFHWSWIHPMFMFVYRPAFTRDMSRLSTAPGETSYFSDTLLKVLLAHSARFRVQDSQHRDAAASTMSALTQQARFSLAMQITNPSSIPTIQALLQQSARDIAFGNSSQAWLYSGMAFRIAIDLGIHLPSHKLQQYVRSFNAEDIEIRKRLFWSCYTWDKAMSLYLGRMPAFTPDIEDNAPEFMDDFTEDDPWEPYYGSDTQNTSDGTARTFYPIMKGHMISCFSSLCSLTAILSGIMLEIYGSQADETVQKRYPNSKAQANFKNGGKSKATSFIAISTRIQNWWNGLPNYLRLEANALPDISPPLHIVSLNLLYQTTLILLHRPFIIGATDFRAKEVSKSYLTCVVATAAIHDLLKLLTTTFGYGHTTYLNCYNTYIAVTISVLHFQLQEDATHLPETDIPASKLDLKFFLGVLQHSTIAMPGLKRSIDIVKRHMQAILDRRSKKYLESLFPVSIFPERVCSAGQQDFMPISSHSGFVIPEQHLSFHTEPAFNEFSFNVEGLPAFPGQNSGIGMDFNLDQEMVDPEIRAVLLGLDPHLILHHDVNGEIFTDPYPGDGNQQ